MSSDVRETPCQICGNKAYKGFHFQVDCCRACAAFYRRSIEAEKIYKCKKGRKNCELKAKIKGTTLCRYCRLERCKELGMRMRRESSNTPSSYETPTSSPQPMPAFSRLKENYDISSDKSHEILSSPFPLAVTLPCQLTFLHRLEYAFSIVHEQFKPKEKFVLSDTMNVEAFSTFYIKIKNGIAKVLMHFNEFVELDFKDKVLLYKQVLYVFLHIERIFTSIECGGNENSAYLMLLHDNTVTDLTRKYDTFKARGEHGKLFETENTLWKNYNEKMLKFLYKPMIDVKLTRFELIYVLAHILWSTNDIKGVSEITHDIALHMTDQISNELHNYYVNERKIGNYSSRLIKMLKLIDASKSLLTEEQNLTLISQMYSILDFNADFSELNFVH